MRFVLTAAWLLGWSLPVMAGEAGDSRSHRMVPAAMRVEDQTGWVVTDEPQPRLAWEPASEVASGKAVAKWELQAQQVLPDGKINELWRPPPWPVADGPWRVWGGPPLGQARQQVRWRVRGLAADGTAGGWSGFAGFETGLGMVDNWGAARWIGMDAAQRGSSAPQLRTTFTVDKPVVRARLYVCGLGYHEAWLNGQRLGDAVLEPGQTDYDRRGFYVTHDVTKNLLDGPNALGVWLGDGFFNQDKVWGKNGLSYGQPRLLARLEIVHADGTRTAVVSDTSWRCARSAVVASNVYQGETYDARLAVDDWARAGFPATDWQAVVPMDVLVP